MITIEQLKKETKIGDKYRWFYSDGILTGKLTYGVKDSGIVKTVTRFTEKSVWLGNERYAGRYAWNSLLKLINQTTFQKEV